MIFFTQDDTLKRVPNRFFWDPGFTFFEGVDGARFANESMNGMHPDYKFEGKFGITGLTNPLAKPKSRHLMAKSFHSTNLHYMEKSKKGSPHRCVFTLFMMPPLNSII